MRLVVGDDDGDCDDCTGLCDVADDFLRIDRGEPKIFWFGDHASTTTVATSASTTRELINTVLDIMMNGRFE